MTEQRKIRVLIADDFEPMRDVINSLVEAADDIDIVAEALRLGDALVAAEELQPDVIIMNDYLPPLDSASAIKRFREQGISIPVLILSMNVEPELIHRSFANGANGFMERGEMMVHLLDAIRQVHVGQKYISPMVEAALENAED